MTKRSNNVRRSQRPAYRRRNNQRRRSRRSPVLPPAKTIMGHIMRTVVQCFWDVAQGALSSSALGAAKPNPVNMLITDVDDGYILANYWRNRFKGLFKELKVHRITAHYVPYEDITAPGEYVFSLYDYGENTNPDSASAAIGGPASVVRKNGTPSKLVWYPTEPDDRNWHVIGDKHNYCSFAIYQCENSYNVDEPGAKNEPRTVGVQGKIVVEADVSFRGKPASPTFSIQHDADHHSEEYINFQQDNNCTCKKCIRPILRRFMKTSTSGSSSPFSIVGEMGSVALN